MIYYIILYYGVFIKEYTHKQYIPLFVAIIMVVSHDMLVVIAIIWSLSHTLTFQSKKLSTSSSSPSGAPVATVLVSARLAKDLAWPAPYPCPGPAPGHIPGGGWPYGVYPILGKGPSKAFQQRFGVPFQLLLQ